MMFEPPLTAPPANRAQPTAYMSAVCALGRTILAEDSRDGVHMNNDLYFYVGDDKPFGLQSNLFHVCPDLARALPPKLHLATPEMVARVQGPLSGSDPKPTPVSWIAAPEFDAGFRTAVVMYGGASGGLGASIVKARYVLKNGTWQADGPAQMVGVS